MPSIRKPQLQFNLLRKSADEKAVPDGLEASSPCTAVEDGGCTESLCSTAAPQGTQQHSNTPSSRPPLQDNTCISPSLFAALSKGMT